MFMMQYISSHDVGAAWAPTFTPGGALEVVTYCLAR